MGAIKSFEFGPFRLLADGRLVEGGRPVPLTRKEAAVLRVLAEAEGAVVAKDELVARAWEGVAVTDNSLTRCVHTLRRQLESAPGAPGVIETLYGRGYRIAVPVRRVEPEIRLLVRPFCAREGPGEATPLEEQVTLDVIEDLRRLHGQGLSVISLHTALHYRRLGTSVSDVTSALDVGFVLSARLTAAAPPLAAEIVLERTGDPAPILTGRFESVDSVGLAAAVTREVLARLPLPSSRLHLRLAAAAASEPRVYEAYLEARSLFRSRTPERLRRAISLYEQAAAWDRRYAPAWVGLIDCINALAAMSVISTTDALARGRAMLAQCEAIDPSTPGLTVARATLTSACEWDFVAAERLFRRALAAHPSDNEGLVFYARHLRASGRPDRGLEVSRALLDLDPLQAVARAARAYDLACTGAFDAAIREARRAVETDRSPVTLCYLACVAGQAGAVEEGLDAARAAFEAAGGGDIFLATLAWACARAGRRDEALGLAADAESRDSFLAASPMSLVCAALADGDGAVRWLERGLAGRCVWLPVIRVDHRLDPVRDDPRVQALLDRVRPDGPETA